MVIKQCQSCAGEFKVSPRYATRVKWCKQCRVEQYILKRNIWISDRKATTVKRSIAKELAALPALRELKLIDIIELVCRDYLARHKEIAQ